MQQPNGPPDRTCHSGRLRLLLGDFITHERRTSPPGGRPRQNEKTGNDGVRTSPSVNRATVREDYSDAGDPWDYFPHDHARSRAYR
jgi:hypothetical protein